MQHSKGRIVLGFVCGAGALALFLVARSGVTGTSDATLVTREVSLGKIDPGEIPDSLAVSPNNKRVAYVAKRGGKLLVTVDGVEGKEYDGIWVGSLVFSPDSERVVYGAQQIGRASCRERV